MSIEKIESEVFQWAADRGLMFPEYAYKQALKLFEEGGEVARAVLNDDQAAIVDGIGDCLVVLAILARQRGTSLEECFLAAWNEIKDRKGRTVGGTFIKD